MQRKTKQARRGAEEQDETDADIDVFNIQLPFYRVFSVAWVDYHPKLKLLAVSRSNSTVEMWSYPYWHVVTKVHLQREITVRKSFIVEKNEKPGYLAIVTANSYVIVFDFSTGEFKQHLLHGGEFAFDADFVAYREPPAVAPGGAQSRRASLDMEEERLPSRKASHALEEADADEDILGRLILACNDGACRYYEMSHSGLFQLKFTTQSKAEKATACCFVKASGKPEAEFCVGYDSGDIRVFSFRTKQLLTYIAGQKSKDSRATVWAVQAVAPHFVVSGCSSGMVKIHETRYGTLVKEFREHSADILDIKVSQCGLRIYASGSDSQIAIIGKSVSHIDDIEVVEFKLSSKDRGQSHDVYCLVELHADLLLSAGNSTDLCLYKIENGGFRDRRLGSHSKVKLRHITCVNAGRHVDFSHSSNLLAVNTCNSLDLFLLDKEALAVDYLAKISIDEFAIKHVCLSQTAAYLAIASAGKIELFSFNKKRKTLTRISTDFCDAPVKNIAFSGQLLYFVSEEEPEVIQIYDLATSKITRFAFKELLKVKTLDVFKVAANGKRVLVADKLNRALFLFELVTSKALDLSGYRKARVMDAEICRATNAVFIVYETNTLLKVDPAGKVIYFSNSKLPKDLNSLHDRYFRVHSHPSSKNKVLIGSLYSFARLDTSKVCTEIDKTPESEVLRLPEDGREAETKDGQLRIVKCSKPILGFCVGTGSMVVVRFDWKSAMSEIAHPVITKKFGL